MSRLFRCPDFYRTIGSEFSAGYGKVVRRTNANFLNSGGVLSFRKELQVARENELRFVNLWYSSDNFYQDTVTSGDFEYFVTTNFRGDVIHYRRNLYTNNVSSVVDLNNIPGLRRGTVNILRLSGNERLHSGYSGSRYAAFAITRDGSDMHELYIRDLDKNRMYPHRFPLASRCAWSPLGMRPALYYNVLDPVTLRSYMVKKHILGTGRDRDTVVYESTDPTETVDVVSSKDFASVFVTCQTYDRSNIHLASYSPPSSAGGNDISSWNQDYPLPILQNIPSIKCYPEHLGKGVFLLVSNPSLQSLSSAKVGTAQSRLQSLSTTDDGGETASTTVHEFGLYSVHIADLLNATRNNGSLPWTPLYTVPDGTIIQDCDVHHPMNEPDRVSLIVYCSNRNLRQQIHILQKLPIPGPLEPSNGAPAGIASAGNQMVPTVDILTFPSDIVSIAPGTNPDPAAETVSLTLVSATSPDAPHYLHIPTACVVPVTGENLESGLLNGAKRKRYSKNETDTKKQNGLGILRKWFRPFHEDRKQMGTESHRSEKGSINSEACDTRAGTHAGGLYDEAPLSRIPKEWESEVKVEFDYLLRCRRALEEDTTSDAISSDTDPSAQRKELVRIRPIRGCQYYHDVVHAPGSDGTLIPISLVYSSEANTYPDVVRDKSKQTLEALRRAVATNAAAPIDTGSIPSNRIRTRYTLPWTESSYERALRLLCHGRDDWTSPSTSPPDSQPSPTTAALLRVYGAYGTPLSARYRYSDRPLLDRRWLLATTHVRGGGELGHAWHRAARGMHGKLTSHKDFLAAARFLIAAELVAGSERMACWAESAGALVPGALLSMVPGLFRSVILRNAFLDVYRSMLDPNAPCTTLEYEEWCGVTRDALGSYGNGVQSRTTKRMLPNAPFSRTELAPLRNWCPMSRLEDLLAQAEQDERLKERNNEDTASSYRSLHTLSALPNVFLLGNENDSRTPVEHIRRYSELLHRISFLLSKDPSKDNILDNEREYSLLRKPIFHLDIASTGGHFGTGSVKQEETRIAKIYEFLNITMVE